MRKFILFLIGALLTTQVFALQIKGVVDNETVSAKISSLDITRIIVQGDRIKNFKGISGVYTRENDKDNGEVYIQPTPNFQSTPFTVLVETEQGRHYTLFLTPIAVPGGTLMLVPKGVGKYEAARFEQASDYELTISHLIRAMSTGAMPEGYVINEVDSNKVFAIGNIATLRLKTIYQGLNFQGQIFELTNTQSRPITLNEREFYKVGTRAISLQSITVSPHSKIKVLRVVSHA
jgi:type-F conjugative transfer system secretin TraK